MSDAFKQAEKTGKKRKLSNQNSNSAKKLKLDKGSKKKAEKETKKKKLNAKNEDSVVISDSDSEDEVSLSEIKKSIQTNGITKKQKKKDKEDSSQKGTPKKNTSKIQKQNEKTPPKKSAKSSKDKKGLKQVTLFDLSKKGKSQQKKDHTTPQKKTSPVKKKPPPTPMVVKHLLSAKRDTASEKVKWTFLMKKAVATLTPTQVKNLPAQLKTEFEQKKIQIEEKKKLASMTPQERTEYLKEKKKDQLAKQKDRLNEKLREQRKRFEDTELTLTPLPEAKLVSTPDGFPNDLFGDVAMVTEFINCFGGLLMPDSEYPIYTDALIKALVGGPTGFTYLSRVLTVLLQTLLQDQITEVGLLLTFFSLDLKSWHFVCFSKRRKH